MLPRVSRSSGTLHPLPTRNLQHGQCEQAHQVKCWGHHVNVTQWRHANSGIASCRANKLSSHLIKRHTQRAASQGQLTAKAPWSMYRLRYRTVARRRARGQYLQSVIIRWPQRSPRKR
ncbi:hypothetical protein TRVL_07233 [Trypanosoma vivax]|nr:hypothetical protein TRVL_07233 [Trypanosoma vivax]